MARRYQILQLYIQFIVFLRAPHHFVFLVLHHLPQRLVLLL